MPNTLGCDGSMKRGAKVSPGRVRCAVCGLVLAAQTQRSLQTPRHYSALVRMFMMEPASEVRT